MKSRKLLTLIAIATVSLSFMSCGKNDKVEPTEEKVVATETEELVTEEIGTEEETEELVTEEIASTEVAEEIEEKAEEEQKAQEVAETPEQNVEQPVVEQPVVEQPVEQPQPQPEAQQPVVEQPVEQPQPEPQPQSNPFPYALDTIFYNEDGTAYIFTLECINDMDPIAYGIYSVKINNMIDDAGLTDYPGAYQEMGVYDEGAILKTNLIPREG